MRAIFAASLLLAIADAATAYAAPDYKIVDRIKVGDGGFDYAVFDSVNGRVLMARTNYTAAIDTKTGKVSELSSASAGHMALPIPGTDMLVLPRGKGTIAIVDGKADTPIAELPAGNAPDGAAYDPFSKLVFVMNHNGGDATLLDPSERRIVATVPVGGVLEFPVSDGAGKVFVNIQDKGEIGVIDVKARQTVARWTMNDCKSPTGLAYVPGANLLVSSCGQNGVAKILRADTGAEVASLHIAIGADAVLYDAKRKVALIPCRAGELDVISLADPAHISVVQRLPTQAGSRTGALDPETGRIYSMAAKFGSPTAPGGRPQPIPGTFEVLVIAP